MPQSAPFRIDRTLEDLVNQFADPLSFFRELIQNSIDAGSREVEVVVEYDEEGDDGVAVIRVRDWGSGMTREIIEQRLTRLFSSAKDGDLTKIGKFGIGFVSVFAIAPEAVCVDTARDGDAWRVLFSADRSFELYRLDEPLEGTEVRIFKTMTRAEVDAFRGRAEAVLRHWCRHVDIDLRFDGRPIAEPFDIDAPCRVRVDDGFSNLVVGHPWDGKPSFGFYNSGLTLEEGASRFFDALTFKISSPHLEHTLTRDRIIEDERLHRVLETLNAAIDGPLASRVFEMIDGRVRAGEHGPMLDYLYRCAAWHVRRGRRLNESVLARAVFRDGTGAPVSLASLRRRHPDAEVFVAPEGSLLTRVLLHAGKTVLAEPLSEQGRALVLEWVGPNHFVGRPTERYVVVPTDEHDEQPDAWTTLAEQVSGLLQDVRAKVSSVRVARLNATGGRGRVAVSQLRPETLIPLAEASVLGMGLFARRRELVLNAEHPLVSRALELAPVEPHFAAMVVVKAFFLGRRLDEEMDGRLARATEARWRSSRT